MTEIHLLNEPPPARWRIWIVLAIVCFLVSQIWIPATYYLGSQPTSERFAWRMFSSVDLSTWDTRVTVFVQQNKQLIQRDEPIASYLQETYVKLIQRAQFDVVESLMQRLLLQPGVIEARVRALGKFPSGKDMSPIECILRQGEPLEIVSN